MLDGGIVFLKLSTKDLQLWFSNNIFEKNSANFAPCFDVESDGNLVYQHNKFIQNFVSPTVIHMIGAGSISMLNGENLAVHAKNNYYYGNYGFLYGIYFFKI